MSEAALTLSTAPIWSADVVRECLRHSILLVRTSQLHVRSLRGQLDEHDVPESLLRVVRDTHNPHTRLIVEADDLMLRGVLRS